LQWYEHRFFGHYEPYANLHVFGPNCPQVIQHCIFKAWLCDHEDDRLAYAKIKREAASAARDAGESVNEYNKRKEPIIKDILARAFEANDLL
jgi:GrpB-like predicted nucleotidyltransferase (UPF0157 family)